MQLFYYHDPAGNFGDDLNPWLWNQICPDLLADRDSPDLLIGIGTLLGMPLPPDARRKFVIGTGTGLTAPPRMDDSWHVLAVRGPFTARVIGAPPGVALGDGALLLRAMDRFRRPREDRKGVVFMPHISSARQGHWREVCRRAGIAYLDPHAPFLETLDAVDGAELMLADAMHGAIVADTLRVPWVALASSCEINSFKWLDWAASVAAPYRPVRLRHSTWSTRLRDLYWPLTGWDHLAPTESFVELAAGRPGATERVYDRFVGRLDAGVGRKRRHWVAQGVWRRAIDPALSAFRDKVSPARRLALESNLIDRAAEQLAALARQPGVLSDERRLDAAVAGLQDAVERARALQ